MEIFKKEKKPLGTYLKSREMLLVWVFIPIFVALTFLEGTSPLFIALRGALLAVATLAMFFLAFRLVRLKTEQTLQGGEFESVIMGLRDAIIVYDHNFKMLFVNPAAETLFKIRASDVVGMNASPQMAQRTKFERLAQVLFPSLAPVLVPRSASGAFPQVADISFDDPFLALRVTTAPIVDTAGKMLGFVKVIQDRTREVSLIRSKDEFITVASHQLRTPINELKWSIESLVGESGISAGGKEILSHASASAQTLSELIEDLLDVSKIEEGRFGYAFTETDIVAFLGEILNNALPVAERAGIKLYFDRPKESLPKVHIDPQKLGMAVSNLIDNAVRYNVKGGEVTVSVHKAAQGPFLELSIKDTGIGIPREELQKMFGKFFRASNAVKFQTEGTGLGLYIVRNIVRAHGGEVTIESVPERGTTVRVTLPVDPTLIPPKEVPIDY